MHLLILVETDRFVDKPQKDEYLGPMMSNFRKIIAKEFEERIIHESRDDAGSILVADGKDVRALYFDSHNKQSCMLKRYPNVLVLKYSQAMMLAQAFLPKLDRCLHLGLGGGSLVKFLRWHYPHLSQTVIESRQQVIKLAHAYFGLPENDPHIKIIHGDADLYVRKHKPGIHESYDLVLCDLFDENGPALPMTQAPFLSNLPKRVTDNGLVCLNLWSQCDRYPETIEQLSRAFDGQIATLRLGQGLKGKGKNLNVLAFCFNDPDILYNLRDFNGSAIQFSKQTGLRLDEFFEQLYYQNSPATERLLNRIKRRNRPKKAGALP